MERIPDVAILTVSDRSYLALREDRCGPVMAAQVRAWGWNLLGEEIVPDGEVAVRRALERWADERGAHLILTSGGTGLAPRDRTPEATLAVADRHVPGISEWIRMRTGLRNPHACLSRGVAVLRGSTLIVNLPGSPRAVEEYLEALGVILPHALEQISHKPDWRGPDRHPLS